MPIPQFSSFRSDTKPALEPVLPRCFQQDHDQRDRASLDVLPDLDRHLYEAGYGPTNEPLGFCLKELFGGRDPITAALSTRHPK